MRLLADENIPRSAIEFLKARGYDVVTLQEIGKAGTTDEEVAMVAEREGRAVLTLDRDFHLYYFKAKGRVNVILLRPKSPTAENVKELLEALMKSKVEPKGLIIVAPKRIRIIR